MGESLNPPTNALTHNSDNFLNSDEDDNEDNDDLFVSTIEVSLMLIVFNYNTF